MSDWTMTAAGVVFGLSPLLLLFGWAAVKALKERLDVRRLDTDARKRCIACTSELSLIFLPVAADRRDLAHRRDLCDTHSTQYDRIRALEWHADHPQEAN